MASLVESGMKNLNFGDADSVGFFQMRVGIWNQGDVRRLPRQARAAGQVVPRQRRGGQEARGSPRASRSTTRTTTATGSPTSSAPPSSTAAATRPSWPRPRSCSRAGRRRAAAAPAAAAAGRCRGRSSPAGGGGSSLGAAALQIAQSQKGVREIGGANRGPQVDQYLAAAKVAPGNPWCASFITWSLEKAGHKMPGGGWAAVATWVRNAEQGNNGLKIVSAEEARPGRHRRLRLGRPERLRRRRPHRVPRQHRQGRQVHGAGGQQRRRGQPASRARSGGANIKFIRVEGNAPAGAVPRPAAAPLADQAPPPRRGRSAPIDPTQFGGEGTGGRPAQRRGARAAEQQEHRARLRRHRRHQGRPDRPARRRPC